MQLSAPDSGSWPPTGACPVPSIHTPAATPTPHCPSWLPSLQPNPNLRFALELASHAGAIVAATDPSAPQLDDAAWLNTRNTVLLSLRDLAANYYAALPELVRGLCGAQRGCCCC